MEGSADDISAPSGEQQREIIKRDLILPDGQKRLAFVLDGVFSKEECEEYIKNTEKMGYERALVNTGGSSQTMMLDIRNNYRCMWDTVEEADKIWKRIQRFIPRDFAPDFQPLGLNERLRFLRYNPGEFFAGHFDGVYSRDNGEESLLTVQLYLNEGFEGGNTTFLSRYGQKETCPVVPKTGSILVFEHHILHEGSVVVKGTKYSMRSDVMFKKREA